VIADFEILDAVADRFHYACALVSQHERICTIEVAQCEADVTTAKTRRTYLDENFLTLWICDLYCLNGYRSTRLEILFSIDWCLKNRCSGFAGHIISCHYTTQ
jgi:hypothetical protein